MGEPRIALGVGFLGPHVHLVKELVEATLEITGRHFFECLLHVDRMVNLGRLVVTHVVGGLFLLVLFLVKGQDDFIGLAVEEKIRRRKTGLVRMRHEHFLLGPAHVFQRDFVGSNLKEGQQFFEGVGMNIEVMAAATAAAAATATATATAAHFLTFLVD